MLAQPAGPGHPIGAMSRRRDCASTRSPGETKRLRPGDGGRPSHLPRGRTAGGKGTVAHRGRDKDGGTHLGPAGRAGDGPAAARRGLKSPAPPAPPSVRRAHWSLSAPPALAPAPLIGPFESGSCSACSPRVPETAAAPRGRWGARTAEGGPQRYRPRPAREAPRRTRSLSRPPPCPRGRCTRRLPGPLRPKQRLARGAGADAAARPQDPLAKGFCITELMDWALRKILI